jgi:hypothetical protein
MPRNLPETSSMVKVRLKGPHAGDSETLWASPIADNLYRLENSPFFAYGVSWQDIIEAEPNRDRLLEYVRCVKKSGNRTLRVIFELFGSNDEPARAVLGHLSELGCSYEGMQPRLISVNLPPRVSMKVVTDFLNEQPALRWEYADPTYEDAMKRRVN